MSTSSKSVRARRLATTPPSLVEEISKFLTKPVFQQRLYRVRWKKEKKKQHSQVHPPPPPPGPSSASNTTPPKQGEYRCGLIKNKVTHTQQESDVYLQLQANMLLLCSCMLLMKLNANPCEADAINLLSCYGVTLGPAYPLKLVKLTVDFNSEGLLYEELFTLSPCTFYPVYVDMCILHVVESLKCNVI